ncbi:hypothetical protein GCM10023189_34450 [Nibrella saemangeumensis]|uniref:2TM domain-containing protein n=1 Tax=Nibrella saemangeumensis TaxID=1084526 RepID=A0ABP8N249_9BACT
MENRDEFLWKKAKVRVGFKYHLRNYLIINAFLWLLWLVGKLLFTNAQWPGYRFPWPIWVTLGWGIGLAMHYFRAYHTFGERSLVEKEYEKLSRNN